MPAAITIPISTFELSITYQEPAIRLMADRVAVLEALFAALEPWSPDLDEMEIVTTGKPSEQGVKIRIPTQKASFFFSAAVCKFTKESANWSDADEVQRLIEAAVTALAQASGVVFGKQVTILSLHLQLKTVSFREILRGFMSPELLKLDPLAADAMATVLRWPKHRITLDGSAALANGIFVQMEREFDPKSTFNEMKETILNDEIDLLKLLGVEEAEE